MTDQAKLAELLQVTFPQAPSEYAAEEAARLTKKPKYRQALQVAMLSAEHFANIHAWHDREMAAAIEVARHNALTDVISALEVLRYEISASGTTSWEAIGVERAMDRVRGLK